MNLPIFLFRFDMSGHLIFLTSWYIQEALKGHTTHFKFSLTSEFFCEAQMCCLRRRLESCQTVQNKCKFGQYFCKRSVSWSCNVVVYFFSPCFREVWDLSQHWPLGNSCFKSPYSRKCFFTNNSEAMTGRIRTFHVMYFLWMMNYAGIIAPTWLSCCYLQLWLAPHMALLHLAEAYDSFDLFCPYLSYQISFFYPSYQNCNLASQ